MKIPKIIKKPLLFPPQIKIPLKSEKIILKESDTLTVKKIASDYLQLKREGIMPDGYARSLMIEAMPENCMIVHRSMLADYEKSNPTQQALILTNKYVQKLLKAISMNATPLKYKKIEAEEIWSDISTKNLNFTHDTYLAFLNCFALVGDKPMVEKVHDLLVRKQSKQPWTRNVYAGLIAAHHSLGNKYAIKRLFESYEKQFSPINKFGFLDPIDADVNIKIKDMVSQYFNALIMANNYDYFIIILDKISRMTADNIYSLLNEQAYQSIFESLTTTGNSELAKRYFKVVKYHHESSPLKYTVFYNVLDCVTKISTFRESKSVFNVLNNIRIRAVVESNVKAGVNYSPAEITKMFLDYITLSKSHPELKNFRDWKSTLPPLNILTMMAYSLGKSLDVNIIKSFFTSQILTKDNLCLYWSRQLSTNFKNLDVLLKETQMKLDTNNAEKSRNELKSTISWINKRRKRGMTLLYGQTGPFSHIYSALLHGWQDSLKNSDLSVKVDPLEFDSLLQELEALEKDIVLQSEIGKYFNVRNTSIQNEDGGQQDEDEMPDII